MSETFINIDSLQHLEISRQTYPTNRTKIRATTFTWRYAIFSKLISMTSKYFRQLGILSVTFVFTSKPIHESNSVHCGRNFDSQNHYRHPCNTLQRRLWQNYNFSSVSVNNSSNSLNTFSNTVSDKNSWDTSTQHFFFSLLARPLVLPMLFIAVSSPHFAHQHWEGRR